jgi:hypothetical protein
MSVAQQYTSVAQYVCFFTCMKAMHGIWLLAGNNLKLLESDNTTATAMTAIHLLHSKAELWQCNYFYS